MRRAPPNLHFRALVRASTLTKAAALPIFRSAELGPALSAAAYMTSSLSVTFATGRDRAAAQEDTRLARSCGVCSFKVLRLDEKAAVEVEAGRAAIRLGHADPHLQDERAGMIQSIFAPCWVRRRRSHNSIRVLF